MFENIKDTILPASDDGAGYGAGGYGTVGYGEAPSEPEPTPDPEPGAPPVDPAPNPEKPPEPMPYDTVKASGQTIRLGPNERYENKLIDCTTGKPFRIIVDGGGAVVRNLGFKGLYHGDTFQIIINTTENTGERVLVENVYLGDGAARGSGSFVYGPGAVFYHKDARSDVLFRHMNVQGWPNNGFYCSGTNPNGGTVRWERCYGKNNGVATFRGSGGDEVIECVAHNDDTHYGKGWGTNPQHGGLKTGRCVWAWPTGTMRVERSHFDAGTYPAALISHQTGAIDYRSGAFRGGTQGKVAVNSVVGSKPDLTIPAGVPLSPVAAASGTAATPTEPTPPKPTTPEVPGIHPDLQHTLEFVGKDGPTDYFFEIEDGPIEASTVNGAEMADELYWISSKGDRAAGRVPAGGRHAYEFDTLLVDMTVEPRENVDVIINETASNLDRYPLAGATEDNWKMGFPWLKAPEEADDDIAALQARVAELEAALEASEEKRKKFKAEVKRLEQQVADANAATAALQKKLDDATRGTGGVRLGSLDDLLNR